MGYTGPGILGMDKERLHITFNISTLRPESRGLLSLQSANIFYEELHTYTSHHDFHSGVKLVCIISDVWGILSARSLIAASLSLTEQPLKF